MKIYTKTGDKGETSLLGGTRVPKDHIRLETIGAIDEINAIIGMAIAFFKIDKIQTDWMLETSYLKAIQNDLFILGSYIAAEKENVKLPNFDIQRINILENQIDLLESNLPKLTHFILPGGTTNASILHLARTITRRAERSILKIQSLIKIPVVPYLNRLSDFLFVLARHCNMKQKCMEDLWIGNP